MTTTRQIVEPILYDTYGKGSMVEALATHLAGKIDGWDDHRRYPEHTREEMILETCWDWMTGGDTAAYVARKIEEALP